MSELDQISVVKQWLHNDEKFLMLLRDIVDALDKSDNKWYDDHQHKFSDSKLESLVLVQRQKVAVDLTTGLPVWVNLKRDGNNKREHDDAWCTKYPVWCKNPLYLFNDHVHLSTCDTGFGLGSHRQELTEKKFYIQNELLWEDRNLSSIREYNVLLTVNELKDLIVNL